MTHKKVPEPGSGTAEFGTAMPEILKAPGSLSLEVESTLHDPLPSLIAISEGFGARVAVSQTTPFPGAEGVTINQYCAPARSNGSSKESTTMGGLFVPNCPRTPARSKVSNTVPGWLDESVAKLISTPFTSPIPSANANVALSNVKLEPVGIRKG